MVLMNLCFLFSAGVTADSCTSDCGVRKGKRTITSLEVISANLLHAEL